MRVQYTEPWRSIETSMTEHSQSIFELADGLVMKEKCFTIDIVWGQRCLSIFQHVQAIKLGN